MLGSTVQRWTLRISWIGALAMCLYLSEAAQAGSSSTLVSTANGDARQRDYTRPLGSSGFLDVQVNAGNDDAEQAGDASMSLNSSDLELMVDGSDHQDAIGLRFNNITVPPGAAITTAYIEFTAKGDNSGGSPSYTITGHDTDNSGTFTTANGDVTSRSRTSASVNWITTGWTDDVYYQTSDVSTIVQEIVDRPGWSSGNSMSFIIEGNDVTRRAEAFDGTPGEAPRLHIEYDDVVGACCSDDGSCAVTTEADCAGTYQGDDATCDPNPCAAPMGACCLSDGTCFVTTAETCVDGTGVYQGDDTTCDPNPCPPTPIRESTWGAIKNTYR